jgi:hypothetical protein
MSKGPNPMSILTASRPDVKPTTLTIKGLPYTVSRIDPGEEGTAAFRLDKVHGEGVYDVVRTHGGLVRCDCPDYEVRHTGTAGMCKHGRALVESGMIEAAAARPVPSKPAVAPITRKDQVRASYFGLKLPASAPVLAPIVETIVVEAIVVEAPAVAPIEAPAVAPIEAPALATMGLAGPRPTWLDRFTPTPEMEMEHLGYALGYEGEDARAPEGRSFPELVAFYGGWLAGRADQEAEFNLWLASVEADRERMDDVFGSPEDIWPESELLEARSYSGHPAYEN